MSDQLEQQIISWNYLSAGTASSMDDFLFETVSSERLIVCDPVSVAHLLSRCTTYQAAVEAELAQGRNSIFLDDQTTLNRIVSAVNERIIELVRFLVQGGFLIYFLRPQFQLIDANTNASFDNYCWLDTLRPSEPERSFTMLSAKPSRIIEFQSGMENGPWAEYLQHCQHFGTLSIPTEVLKSDYTPIALVDREYTLAAGLNVGGSGGGIVFLPAPATAKQKKLFNTSLLKFVEQLKNRELVFNPRQILNKAPGAPAGTLESPLDSLRKLKSSLRSQKVVEETSKSKIEVPTQRLAVEYESLLDLLLYQGPEEIAERLSGLFEQAGWQVVPSESPSEIYVGGPNDEMFIVTVSDNDTDTILKDLSHLARAIILAWAKQEYEPRGILIAVSRDFFNSSKRLKGTDFDTRAFASRNNIKLLTVSDLGRLLKSMLGGNITAESVCNTMVAETTVDTD